MKKNLAQRYETYYWFTGVNYTSSANWKMLPNGLFKVKVLNINISYLC